MKIHILPPALQQYIAAGEVVERPASVVKELVENALDAGAQHIRVEVEHGGRQLIRVTDDGSGMSPDDVPLAFERFATSKLHDLRDIESVRTFGFRGEALPSIAAVSRVQLLTRPPGATLATGARLEGNAVLEMGEAGSPVGTRVEVRDLFFNTPVRRRFLRSLRVELSHIMGVFTTFAIAFPEHSWSLLCDGKPIFELAAGSYRDRLLALYGQEVTAQLESFEAEGLSGRAWGSVSREPAVGRRAYRFFVNRRPVRSASLYRAAHTALGGSGMLILFVEIPPPLVDVNVHPAKREVRFRDEEGVYDLVVSPLMRLITRGNLRSESIAEREEPYPQIPAATPETFQAVGQVEATFLLASAHGHLYVVDQHAAHERVLYDRLLEANARGEPPRRTLVSPQVLVLASQELEILEQHRAAIEACGFVLDLFGPGAVAVRAIPEFISIREAERLCRRLVQRLRRNAAERRDETVPQIVACLGALKAGTTLPLPEQQRLLSDWGKSSQAHACAHNRPVYVRLSLDELRRRVGRTVGSCEDGSSQA
jgi:DNA mismatch repair protein MutL